MPELDKVGKPTTAAGRQLNIYTKATLTGVMNEQCQALQDEMEQHFDPESIVYSEENIESKRSEIDMQTIYENQQIAESNKAWADQVEKSTIEIQGDDGVMIKVLVNKSKNCGPNSAAFVYAHRGNAVTLSAKQCNELMVRWAHKYNCVVFNVDYRLAPEAKAPAAQRDFMHAFYHVYNNAADFGVDPNKIAIGGDNGGGWVCIGAAYQMIKDGKSHLPKMMILRSSMHSNMIQAEAFGNLHNYEKYTQDMQYSIFNLLATDFEAQNEDPLLYPAKMPIEDLKKLPPTIICTGEFDHMRRESMFLISRLKQTDKLLDVLDMPQVFHGYENDVNSDPAIQAETETIKVWNHVMSK